MSERTAGSIRVKVRAEMIEAIKDVARAQIADHGASLSMRAVAREMGMVSSGLYRYFASRDDLLTALIIDAYNSFGDTAETADAAVADRTDLTGRWLAVAHALRDWALARPHEYALIYGSPVPGYTAPDNTLEPSTRQFRVLGAIVADLRLTRTSGEDSPPLPAPELPAALTAELAVVATTVAQSVPEPIMARAVIAWTELFGTISFEVFGRFNKIFDHRAEWFDYQARAMATFIGL